MSRSAAGVLLHPGSLPSGKLDSAAEWWLDWMARAGFSVWQVLPFGVPQANRSPYMCLSSFAMNPGFMTSESLQAGVEAVDSEDYSAWYGEHRDWLDEFSLFMALKQAFSGQAWFEWPDDLRRRDPEALKQARNAHGPMLELIKRQQYVLHRRWQALRDYGAERGVTTFGDLPIFVAHDSADVWANQDCFLLDELGQPTHVAGVPPDYFSATGQRWGNPQYDWAALERRGFDYWLRRLEYHLRTFDRLRIDHFRGLEAVWMIPADRPASDGYWQTVPGAQLLNRVMEMQGSLPLVAENLGTITPEVEALRRKFGLPGMAVLQFAWDGSPDNPHLPQNITSDCVVYTGTHDNDTTRGWYDSLDASVRAQVRAGLKMEADEDICDIMLERALHCEAELAVFPLQDLLGLGSAARMNTPGTDLGNWEWRVEAESLSATLADQLRSKLERAGRLA